MNTKTIFKNLNRDLALRLIPSKELPIYCNSVTDAKDESFNYTLKENGFI